MKKLLLLTFLMINYSTSWAQYDNAINEVFEQKDLKKLNQKKFNKDHHKYMANERMIGQYDDELGIINEAHYSGLDNSRFSIAYHFSHDYQDFGEISSLDFQYSNRMRSYSDLWWGVQYKSVRADFHAISDNRSKSATEPDTAEENIQRNDNDIQVLTIFGGGVGYRFKFLLDFIDIKKNMFETTMVYFNRVTHNDKSIDKIYNGWGTTMEYGIHNRSGSSFFYGGKLSYNLTSTIREQIGNEGEKSRTFVTGWTDLAFEFGYYY